MIKEREERCKLILQERQAIKDEIGKAMAERDFLQELGSFKLVEEYNNISDKITKLSDKFYEHMNEHETLTKQLEHELSILNILLTQ